uniref:Protein kinase domain-containing protein n=1 Tax=Parastrongyloides trichosuri TaxID=131310 RepID=A0A0N4ZSR7_PARTI
MSEDGKLPDLTGTKFRKIYYVLKALDKGGFGAVYIVWQKPLNEKDPSKLINPAKFQMSDITEANINQFKALKAELNDVDGATGLKMEVKILKTMTKTYSDLTHYATLGVALKKKRYCYAIMTLLGRNLKSLVQSQPNKRFTKKTWLRICIQTLYGIKKLHEIGYLHRDIKPPNFAIGHSEDVARSRIVHVLDFGLSRQFAARNKHDKFVFKAPRKVVDFRGTARYCSINIHFDKECGRKDDIWSWLFSMMDLYCGTPWESLRGQEMEEFKMKTTLSGILAFLPEPLKAPTELLSKVDILKRPSYESFYKVLKEMMIEEKATFLEPYDWETTVNMKARHLENYLSLDSEMAADYITNPIKKPKADTESEEAINVDSCCTKEN